MQNLLTHNCKQELKEHSLKTTPIRLKILNILENSSMPIDAKTIFDYLSGQKLNADFTTVFRTINSFVDKGIVRSIDLNEGKRRFEYGLKPEHHHLVCEKCKIIEDISDCNIAKLENEISKKKKFMIKRHALEFFGLCKNCQ